MARALLPAAEAVPQRVEAPVRPDARPGAARPAGRGGVVAGRSLGVRLVIGAAVWVVLMLVAAGLGLSALFRTHVERSYDVQLGLLIERLIAASQTNAGGDVTLNQDVDLPRFEKPFSGWYWQITPPSGEPTRARSLWDRALPPITDLAPGESRAVTEAPGPGGRRLYGLHRAVLLPDAAGPTVYTVAVDAASIEGEVRRFQALLYPALAGLGVGLVLAVLVQVVYGLQPLRRIKRALLDVRSGKASRLEGTFPAEIVPLAREINALLDHGSEVVERARTQAGNLAHALKTPLSVLMNESSRPAGPSAELTRRQVEIMRRQVEHHLARARAAATAGTLGARAPVAPAVDDLVRTLRRIHRERTFESAVPDDLAFRGEAQDLEEMVGNLLDNAGKWASGRVRLEAEAGQAGRIVVRIDDDGPGLAPEARVRMMRRGARLDETRPGSGLGLDIVRDMAVLYGGGVRLEDSPLGGLRAVLDLPSA